jgi:hypothetical protein
MWKTFDVYEMKTNNCLNMCTNGVWRWERVGGRHNNANEKQKMRHKPKQITIEIYHAAEGGKKGEEEGRGGKKRGRGSRCR